MIKKIFSILLVLFCLGVQAEAKTPEKPVHHPKSRSTASLQKYMSEFGSWFAGMEIMRSKEKKTDWKVLNESVAKMIDSLKALQSEDKKNLYKQFTDQLEKDFGDLQKQAGKKDKEFFKTLDRMSQTCFSCHAQNRPQDFLFRADNQ